MRILADECVFRITTETLRQTGHDVATVQDLRLAGQADDTVLEAATGGGYVKILLKCISLVSKTYPPSRYHGIVVLKIRPRTQQKVHAALLRFLAGKEQGELDRCLIIVDPNKYRIRRGR